MKTKILQCTEVKDVTRKDANKILNCYKSDTIFNRFYNKLNLPRPNSAKIMLDNISRKICGKNTPPLYKDLAYYLDTLKMYGRQHIFLFNLKKGEEAYLDDLSKPENILKKLRKYKMENRYNNNFFIRDIAGPCLANVRHVNVIKEESHLLTFKWIETRAFMKKVGSYDYIKKYERAVNFFTIDLTNGFAELWIQLLQSNSFRDLSGEYEVYVNEISKYIDLDKFDPVKIEPISRKFLLKHILVYTVHVFVGKPKMANKKVPFFTKIGYFFLYYILKSITVYWKCEQKSTGNKRLFFTLDCQHNNIVFGGISDKSRVDYILTQFHKFYKKYLEERKTNARFFIEVTAKDNPDQSLVNSYIEKAFDKEKRSSIDSKTAAYELGISEASLKYVFNILKEKYPDDFTLITEKDTMILEFTYRFFKGDGLIDFIIRFLERKKIGSFYKIFAKFSFPPLLGIVNILIIFIIEWFIEITFDVPFILIEIGANLLSLYIFYGNNRIRKYLKDIPIRSVVRLFRPESNLINEIVINEKRYKKWEKENPRYDLI
ncbi:hypothetical protein ACFL6O_03615 [candidate division KSB1 bacterium]